MRWWRLWRKRSLRRTALYELRANRQLGRLRAWREEVPAALRELKWWRATALAVALHLPFVIGLLSAAPPAWLDTAWQVSATLVGLGIAVVVFLLQTAGSQNLSSGATYR